MNKITIDHGAIEQLGREIARDVARDTQPKLNRFAEVSEGKPVDQILPELQKLLADNALDVPAETLRDMAENISQGVMVQLKTR
jgi:hypothetical protein